MTDRVNALTVVLEQDVREDDVQPLVDAIRMMRGVLRVKKHVATIDSHVAEQRAQQRLREVVFVHTRSDGQAMNRRFLAAATGLAAIVALALSQLCAAIGTLDARTDAQQERTE